MTNEDKVREFHVAFNHPTGGGLKDRALVALRVELIDEEFQELITGIYKDDLVEVADAIADLLYVTYGFGVALGLPVDRLFAEVHRSNMSKLDEDGNAILRQDGKVLKSNLYSPPDIEGVLNE